MRRLLMIIAAFFAAALIHSAAIIPSAAIPAAGAAKKPKPSVKIFSTGQKQLINHRYLKVRIRSTHRGRIKVRAQSTTYDRRGRYYGFTKVIRPRFRRARQKRIIKIRLTRSGVDAVRRCEDRDIRVIAGATRSRIKPLVRQTSDCAPRKLNLSRADRCDFIIEQTSSTCMAPFPSNFYTRGDEATETGRRIDFEDDAMPVNAAGKPIDAAPYNSSDGFSQGQSIVLRAPGLDNLFALARTNPAGLNDPGAYLDPDAPVVVMKSATGERQPIWVEVDMNASSDSTRNLIIHPMVNFDAGARYIVALRGLESATGATLKAPPGFRYYRDLLPSRNIRINQRRSYFEDIFRRLRNRGIPRRDLYLAWDFTVASDENNSSRALSMRDQAFNELGDTDLSDRKIPAASAAPSFTVDSVVDDPDPQVARRIEGSFEVPCYLRHPTSADECAPGATINLDPAGTPVRNGTYEANFDCIVPNAAVPAPGRAMVYGHGLMGTIGGEVGAAPQRDLADHHGFVICGTDEIGMSTGDLGTVAAALTDLSGFPAIPDRLQQGLINELYLARLMIHPDGLVSDPEFRSDPNDIGSDPVIEPGRAFYRGNSQGGIMGGALTALAPDFDRSALGVSAMNYSVLLNRSRAWDDYSAVFNPAYPNEVERPLVLGIAQMLWDRGESNGYAHRMTHDPLPDTPAHKVLMDVAFGDHLVTNWQSNVMARTIGARGVDPLVYPGRWPGFEGQWGITPIAAYPADGSAIAYWDSGPVRPDPDNPGETIGNDPPPLINVPPRTGVDPHEHPRRADTDQQMVSDFLKSGGRVTDTCAPSACYGGDFTGP